MRHIWLILPLLLAACGQPDPSVIRFGLANAPLNLDPRHATDATSVRINRLLYRALVDFDEHSRPVPSLARWQRLSSRHYRFILGETGRVFHDGSRLTAHDVAATYASVLDPANASPLRQGIALIHDIRVIDPDTIDFYLTRPDPLFPARLVVGIVPEKTLASGHDLQHRPVGSGPFRFIDWPREDRLVLQRRNDGQRFEFLRVADPMVRSLKLLRGEIDLLQNDLAPELFAYLEDRDGIRVTQAPGYNFTYLGLNLEDPALARLEVRKALAHAIDRQAILGYVFRGAGRLAEALLPPEHWAGPDRLEPWRHDPALARRLLERAGYGRQHPLKLVFKTSSDPFRLRLATILQAQLAEAGIAVELRSHDWSTFYGDVKAGNFQLYSLAWVGIRTPDIFRYAFHSSSLPPHGANRGRYRSPELDRLIEEAESAPILDAQARAWRRVQARLHRDLPVIPLWFEAQTTVMRADIQGYRPAGDGNYDALLHVRRR